MNDLVGSLRHLSALKSLSGHSQFAREAMGAAADEIERLRKIEDAPAAERGWRTFWQEFVERLHLGHDQRTYGWHELMDCCQRGMKAVERDTK